MNYVGSVARLIRLPNCILAALSTTLGGYLQSLDPQLVELPMAALATASICAAGNALNDRLDVEADRINHPTRPLPCGELSLTEASLVALVAVCVGVFFAALVSLPLLLMSLLWALILVWYNFRLKKSAFVGNLAVAFLAALTLPAGGIAAGGALWSWPGVWFPAALAFALHFSREMIKDSADLEGDRVAGFITYPIRRGAAAAIKVTSFSITTLTILTLLPLYFGWYGRVYAYIVILAVDLPLLVILFYLHGSARKQTLRAASIVFKFGMVMGLVALYFGAIAYR